MCRIVELVAEYAGEVSHRATFHEVNVHFSGRELGDSLLLALPRDCQNCGTITRTSLYSLVGMALD